MEENEPVQKEELRVHLVVRWRAQKKTGRVTLCIYRCDAYERRNLDITIFECHVVRVSRDAFTNIYVTPGYRYIHIHSILLDEYSIKDSLDEKSSLALKLRPKLFDKITFQVSSVRDASARKRGECKCALRRMAKYVRE